MSVVDAVPAVRPGTALPVLAVVTIVIGVGAGLGGMGLAMLLHLIQHLAYGYSIDAIISEESFLQGVIASSPLRRWLVLLGCGVVGGCGWWAVHRFCRPLVSVKQAVAADDPRMPVVATTLHALLQIATVALGSPLGREVAPREIGALFAGWVAHGAGLTGAESRVMVACGAGAGLAAVYNVPLAGGLFVLEVLLRSFSLPVAIPALATAVIAGTVAWVGLGDGTQYAFPHFALSASLVAWSVLVGPVLGYAAVWYVRLAAAARARAPRNWRVVPWCLVAFGVIGLMAIPFPQVLGNGKGPTQLGLDGALDWQLAGVLLVLKLLATTGSLRAGAEGGMLTPGVTIGALLAILMGTVWNLVCPAVPLGAFAVVGATAFLASSMSMPITAIALMFEFTRMDQDFLVPVLACVAGSASVLYLCHRPGRGTPGHAPS